MKIWFLLTIFVLCSLCLVVAPTHVSYGQSNHNAVQDILQFSNEQYPSHGNTDDVITINGTITNHIDKDVNVWFTLNSDGHNNAWHMVDSKPRSLFTFENMTIPAEKSINYQYKIRLLKHGTFFFEPVVQVVNLKDSDGNYVRFQISGLRNTITITGQDVDKMVYLRNGSSVSHVSMAMAGDMLYLIWQGKGLADHDDIYLTSSNSGTNFTDPINLSKSEKDSTEPIVAALGKDVYALWQDSTESIGEFHNLHIMGGNIFLPSYGMGRISTGYGEASDGKIVLAGNNAYSVWIENDTHGIVRFNSNPLGVIDNRSYEISNKDHDSFIPQLASNGKDVFLTWEEHKETGDGYKGQIYYSYSKDNGKTFHTILASNDDANSTNPKISLSDGRLYLAYQDSKNDLVLTKSAGDFTSVSNKIIMPNTAAQHLVLIDMKAENNNVYLLWQTYDQNNHKVFLSTSNNYGESFASRLVLENNAYPLSVHMYPTENKLYLTWQNHAADNSNKILFQKSLDGGQTFDDPMSLSDDKNPVDPYVVGSANNVYVAWTDSSASVDHVFFRTSHDSGKNFDNPIYLTGTSVENNTLQPANIFEQMFEWMKKIFHWQ